MDLYQDFLAIPFPGVSRTLPSFKPDGRFDHGGNLRGRGIFVKLMESFLSLQRQIQWLIWLLVNDQEKDRASDKELGGQEMTVAVELECCPK